MLTRGGGALDMGLMPTGESVAPSLARPSNLTCPHILRTLLSRLPVLACASYKLGAMAPLTRAGTGVPHPRLVRIWYMA